MIDSFEKRRNFFASGLELRFLIPVKVYFFNYFSHLKNLSVLVLGLWIFYIFLEKLSCSQNCFHTLLLHYMYITIIHYYSFVQNFKAKNFESVKIFSEPISLKQLVKISFTPIFKIFNENWNKNLFRKLSLKY